VELQLIVIDGMLEIFTTTREGKNYFAEKKESTQKEEAML
jgi:hypothetical protein